MVAGCREENRSEMTLPALVRIDAPSLWSEPVALKVFGPVWLPSQSGIVARDVAGRVTLTDATHCPDPALPLTIHIENTANRAMAPKRRVTIQSDSEDEAPRATQRKRQRTSAEETETGAESTNNAIDEEEEREFEREHEEAFMQRIQERADDVKKHKVIGVRCRFRLVGVAN